MKEKKRIVIIRSKSAGCFYGELVSGGIGQATMANCRRLWYWDGAASLSQLAQDGTSHPAGCKFPTLVTQMEVGEVIEVLDTTAEARASIESVPVWRA